MKLINIAILILSTMLLLVGCSKPNPIQQSEIYEIEPGGKDVKYPSNIETEITVNSDKIVITEETTEEKENEEFSFLGLWNVNNTDIQYFFDEDGTGYIKDPSYQNLNNFKYSFTDTYLQFNYLITDETITYEFREDGSLLLFKSSEILWLTRAE